MLEKPQIDDHKLIDAVREHYGITVTALEFLPIGYDANAGVYRTTAGNSVYFLKVKRGAVDQLSVTIPRYLKAQGVEQVVAPLPTITPDLWAQVDNFALLIYPFIEGEVGMDVGLTDSQWVEFGAILKRLHLTRLMPELMAQINKETFAPRDRHVQIIKRLQTDTRGSSYDNPIVRDFGAYWNSKREDIDQVYERTIELGQTLQKNVLDFVLCHADIHTANVLIGKDGGLHIVDWDQPILAPKERDLMFTVGGTIGGANVRGYDDAFLRGYGETADSINWLAMLYYRYEWIIQDLAEFGESILYSDVGDETKADAARLVRLTFEPGNLLDSARELDRSLSLS